jgi:hypothetical protein
MRCPGLAEAPGPASPLAVLFFSLIFSFTHELNFAALHSVSLYNETRNS